MSFGQSTALCPVEIGTFPSQISTDVVRNGVHSSLVTLSSNVEARAEIIECQCFGGNRPRQRELRVHIERRPEHVSWHELGHQRKAASAARQTADVIAWTTFCVNESVRRRIKHCACT